MTEKAFASDIVETDKRLGDEIKASLVDGYLTCPVAFKIAKKLGVTPAQVGDMTNKQKVRLIGCQLGCFGVKKATHEDIVNLQVSQTLADEIKASLVDGYVPCAVAFEVARKHSVTRKDVGDAATKLKIHIVQCQLGCF
ncbi:MAG: hypothetical protein HY530_04965 [Chloroflexi bacterium]|nr:hypothetical protein [Chloroflexota bacterium]